MISDQDADLIVIGGGVLGTFHAWHALRNGLRVVLLERNAAPRGATVRNFGQVVPSGLDPQWQRFGRESLEIYKTIQQQFDITVRQSGTIYLASNAGELQLLEELREINQSEKYPSEMWSPDQCRDRYPHLRRDYCRGGLFFPEEVSVNPREMIHRLHRFLGTDSNFNAHHQTSVIDLSADADQVTATTTNGETYSAKQAVLCCGSEFQLLFPDLFRNSDLQAVRLQMLRLQPQPSVSLPGNVLTGSSIRRYESFRQCPSWEVVKAETPDDSFGRKWGVHILFKQEADGGIILGDSHEYADAEDIDALSFQLNQDVNEYFIQEGRKIFDLPSWEIETAWSGVYSQTRDPSGIFKQTIQDRIHVATGIGGKGMTSSAGFARQHIQEIFNDQACRI